MDVALFQTTMDCVEYYYRSKKSENYKQMLRKQNVKKKRQQQKQPVSSHLNYHIYFGLHDFAIMFRTLKKERR